MASVGNCHSTWRLVFGDAENWAPPQMENQTSTDESAQHPATWRVIFGNTAAWLPPQLDNSALPEDMSAHRCELCRQPIAEGQDFVTNSAGQRPTHARCLGMASPATTESKPPSRTWLRMLCGALRD